MIWLLVLHLAHSQECPIAKCKSLDADVCVVIADMFLVVNDNGCYKDEFCNVTTAYAQWETRVHDVIYCQEIPDHDYPSDDFECGDRDLTQRLDAGVHPKRCKTDDDCLMGNGETTECECGLDGFKYCKPGLGSQVFDYLWADCDDNGGDVTEEQWRYWLDYQTDYHFFVMAPDCARAIFYELEWLESVPDYAAYLPAIVALILW